MDKFIALINKQKGTSPCLSPSQFCLCSDSGSKMLWLLAQSCLIYWKTLLKELHILFAIFRWQRQSKSNYTSESETPPLMWCVVWGCERPGEAVRDRAVRLRRFSREQPHCDTQLSWDHQALVTSISSLVRALHWDHREDARMSLSKVGNQTSSQDPQAVNSR